MRNVVAQWGNAGGAPWGSAGGSGKGGKGGKGWGKSWSPQRKAPPSLPRDFEVDDAARYTGTVDFYAKWKGYGFIILQQPGIAPSDKVFVHWKSIQSDDRYPYLVKDLEVELSLEKQQDRWNRSITTLRAKNVTLVGGLSISVQDDMDAQEKNFIGGQHLRYTGTLKFFKPRAGFGWVSMDAGYDVEHGVPSDLKVEKAEVNAGGKQPIMMENVAVEFGIWKTDRGEYRVYNMTLPGGHPLTQDALENRISMGAQVHKGEITTWNWRHGWGFLRPEPSTNLPPRVTSKLLQQVQAARSRGKQISEERLLYFRKDDCQWGAPLQRGAKVNFQLYIDDKGAGACEVTSSGGW